MNPHVEDGPHCSVDLTWSVSDRTSISRSAHPPGQQMCSVHTQWEDPAQQDHSYCQTARGKDVRDMITQCDEFGYFMLQNDADALLYTGLNPLSSLRLIVPPLQLVSAALWEIVKQGAVVHYGLLEEFISTVLETVPELLTDTERVQLVMGLRAKVVLELCHSDDLTNLQAIQSHLSRINTYIKNQDNKNTSSEVEASVTNFLELVNTLKDDQCQRDIFYQKIFPTVFGTEYDSALQALMRKFLLSLHKLLPVPNLEQTSLWLSQSPSVLKECVDFLNQPEPLNTLIQHHKHHGHNVLQASPFSADDCILSSLSYRLPKVENDEGDTQLKSELSCVSQDLQIDNLLASESENIKKENLIEIKSELSCVSQDSQIDNLLASESENIKKENCMEIKSELMWNIEINGQQHANDVAEDQGASIEVILQPFDESESYNHVKTGSRKSSKTFKCLICGKDFGSLTKLKRHKTIHHDGLTNKRSQSNSATHKIHAEVKPETCIEAERPPLASATTRSPPNLTRLPDFEQSDANCDLVCHLCGKVYTYQKNFDKHQKFCVVRNKQQAETDQQCSTSLAHLSKLNPADTATESPPSETETEPSHVVPQESLESPQQQTCKRSSRVKQCSVCREVFSCSADLMSHMRCHIEQKDSDNFKDYETHQEDKCRVSQQHSQDNPLSNTKKSKQENPVVSSGRSHVPLITDGPANSQAVKPCKSTVKCQECEQVFTYHKSFEKHQSKCSIKGPQRTKQTKTNFSIIIGCDFQSADNTSRSRDETSSGTAKPTISADDANTSQAKTRTFKCNMCDKNFSKISQMKEHYSKSHKVTESYPCTLCKRTFVRMSELVRHQQNMKLYQCVTCKKCFSKSRLKDHEKIHDACVTPNICETCGQSFRLHAYLVLHQRKHRDKQPNVCSHCGKHYSTKYGLKAHMVRHTGGYPCPVCGKKFYQKIYLRWHLYKHTGKEPYLCDTCGKGWPTAAQLKCHMVHHQEERPFKCEDCGHCYKRQSNLIAHRRAVHIRLRPFSCEVCNKGFRLNKELRQHMRVHTGERPFMCTRCGKKFKRKVHLQQHSKNACR
ncbi:zinc finger protein 658B-like isoform X1 [Acanthopagrus latus]|uniref:zinc finger protein 658B-like isoform X1 n=1 Tax=Acanthopagrus latus TaxID=8177 RepID=UPI00187C3FDC|nr:zinc finger protein 658B-like isoform X1 [Acanthopagrus latus]XP_036941274.1 zinc finger protein 658B-like isoform X1 [Acanthopagrus latus]